MLQMHLEPTQKNYSKLSFWIAKFLIFLEMLIFYLFFLLCRFSALNVYLGIPSAWKMPFSLCVGNKIMLVQPFINRTSYSPQMY